MQLRVRLDELLPIKTAAQRLPEALRRLDSGEADQLVITRRNEPRAVLITVQRYEELLLLHVQGSLNPSTDSECSTATGPQH